MQDLINEAVKSYEIFYVWHELSKVEGIANYGRLVPENAVWGCGVVGGGFSLLFEGVLFVVWVCFALDFSDSLVLKSNCLDFVLIHVTEASPRSLIHQSSSSLAYPPSTSPLHAASDRRNPCVTFKMPSLGSNVEGTPGHGCFFIPLAELGHEKG